MKFFVNIGPESEKCVPKSVNSSPGQFLKNRNQLNLVISHTSEEEVVDIINSLSNKSTGLYSIPLNLLIISGHYNCTTMFYYKYVPIHWNIS